MAQEGVIGRTDAMNGNPASSPSRGKLRWRYRKALEWVERNLRWFDPLIVFIAGLTGVLYAKNSLQEVWVTTDPGSIVVRDYVQSWIPIIFVVSAACSFLSSVVRSLLAPSLAASNQRLVQLELDNGLLVENFGRLTKGYLVELAAALKFEDNGGSDRVSLYVSQSDNASLVPCARYSINPTYNGKGRTSYPANEGCIGRAWENGWHFDNKFPAYTGRKDCPYCLYTTKLYGIDRPTIDGFSMRPQCIAALAVGRKQDHERMAVLVLESTKADRFDEGTVKAFLESQRPFLSNLVETLRPYIATPNEASERGY